MSNTVINGIEILYKNKDCLVINKPAGLMVHSDGRAQGPFLSDWLLENFPKAKDVGEARNGLEGEPVNRSGIVHRLDRETSGTIILALTDKGYNSLKEQFQNRTINKKYLAFVWGEIAEEFGTVDRPIGRSGADFRKWSAMRGSRGEMREAQTYWTKIASANDTMDKIDFNEYGQSGKFSLIQAEPKTGRTHQIRVHFHALNHPVVGDSLYAETKPLVLGFKRLALHSRSLEFTDTSGTIRKVVAPIPEDFQNAIKGLGIVIPKDL